MAASRLSFLMQWNYFIFTTGWTFLCLLTSTTVGTGLEVRQGTSESVTIKITNGCLETIWPAFGTQSGKEPPTGGFELKSKISKEMAVSNDWEGRVWGRTNCSFNADGTGASNGAGQACETGDCNGVLSCAVTGNTPVTLFEIALTAGADLNQTFYDLSLVDGYNLPIGITYLPNSSNPLDIPPNLTNCACIATVGHLTPSGGAANSTFPTPYNTHTTAASLARWCPWDLQLNPPPKPGAGVYPYPDDAIPRPAFAPCLSGCARTGAAADCCTGAHDSPATCSPNLYARAAKAVCPDAYSFAFDDGAATFVVPAGGGGWEVTFCPGGKSTNILGTFGEGLKALSQGPTLSAEVLALAGNTSLIQRGGAASSLGRDGCASRRQMRSLGALVVVLAWGCLW